MDDCENTREPPTPVAEPSTLPAGLVELPLLDQEPAGGPAYAPGDPLAKALAQALALSLEVKDAPRPMTLQDMGKAMREHRERRAIEVILAGSPLRFHVLARHTQLKVKQDVVEAIDANDARRIFATKHGLGSPEALDLTITEE